MAVVEIDGKKVEVPNGTSIIAAAKTAGVYIPHFCYHEKLSVAANCRMCLVEVEKAPKTVPACATPVADGMKIMTHSQKTIDSQKAVMEFLLINHPLDCPICDQGGQCELQDIALEYGSDTSHYSEPKRAVENKELGPLIATEMTRCIHCTRCVRFGDEIAGMRELGGMGRGEHLEIGTYVQHLVRSELSGNAIDVCPVGALTSKPFRFQARAWEMTQQATIAPHDGVGSHVYAQTLREQLLKVVPREAEALNEVWISDRDRFSYEGLAEVHRLQQPMIKRHGRWETVDWSVAMDFLKTHLLAAMKNQPDELAAVAHPSSTVEELFLLQKLIRGLGSPHVDHRIHEQDFRDQASFGAYPGLSIPFAEIEHQQAIILVGANVRREQPLLGYKVRKATLKGAKVFGIQPEAYEMNFSLAGQVIAAPSQLAVQLTAIIEGLEGRTVTPEIQAMVDALKTTEKSLILVGEAAWSCAYAADIRERVQKISSLTKTQIGFLTTGANAAGAWLAGMVPHRATNGATASGHTIHDIFARQRAAYVLMNVEPEADLLESQQALQVLKQAACVVLLTPFVTAKMQSYAQVLLPIASFGETAGTFVNFEGTWQSFQPCLNPPGAARPAWKVLRVLGNQFNLPGFDYTSSIQIRDDVKQQCAQLNTSHQFTKVWAGKSPSGMEIMWIKHLYATDGLVRRSQPLQDMIAEDDRRLSIASDVAKHYGVRDHDLVTVQIGTWTTRLKVRVNARLAPRCVQGYLGLTETAGCQPVGEFRLEKVVV